ncbi:MAG TPA: hypothetical protein PLX16_04545 [Exilispira sp.]|nr:hypothetical protein [Exilispira sp.]
MGQILCLLMVLISVPMLILAQKCNYFDKRYAKFVEKNKDRIKKREEKYKIYMLQEEEKRKIHEKEKVKKLVAQQKLNKKKKKNR